MQKSTVTPGKMPLIIRRKPELERDTKRIHLLRRMVQVGFFTLIGYHVVGTLVVGEDSSIASPEAYCPFGGLETLYSYISTGGRYVPHTHLSNLVLLVAVLALTLVSKSAFCGWICPLGALQDWLFNLRRFFYRGKSPLHLPPLVDRVARSIKYLVLAWLLIETALAAKMAFREYDPYSALLNLGKEVALGGLIVLVVTVVLALFVERPWCTYACPLGATIGLLGRLSLFKIRRDEKTCLSGCTLCNRACPSGLEVKKFKTLATSDCVNCMSCVAGCPTGALAVRLPGLLRSTNNQAQSELVTANSSSPSEEVYREI
ncbi:MAG: 4Fe-4S binding protein [Chloroflexota bacterium]